MNQAPSGLSTMRVWAGLFCVLDGGATTPQRGATDTTRCGATAHHCGATDTNPSRARKS